MAVEEEQDDREEKEEVDEDDGEEEDEQKDVQASPLSLPQPVQVLLALVWKASSLEVRYLSSSEQGRLTDRLVQDPRGLMFQGFSV